jgi:hypothetical protein
MLLSRFVFTGAGLAPMSRATTFAMAASELAPLHHLLC